LVYTTLHHIPALLVPQIFRHWIKISNGYQLDRIINGVINNPSNDSIGINPTILYEDRTIYVRIDGNDSNMGTANTASEAVRTLTQAARLARMYINNGFNIKIMVGPGNFSDDAVVNIRDIFQDTGTYLSIEGVNSTDTILPTLVCSNTNITILNADLGRVYIADGRMTVHDCKLRSIDVNRSYAYIWNIVIKSTGDYTGLSVYFGGSLEYWNVSIAGNPTFSDAFISCYMNSYIYGWGNISGTCTGKNIYLIMPLIYV